MSEYPPASVAEGAADDRTQVLTPEVVEQVLADFRTWLHEAAQAESSPAGEAEPVDLHTLVGQFVALRHEVNLQTRAVRAQQEQNSEALRQLGQALDALHQAQAVRQEAEQKALDDQQRPLLKTLIDLFDALSVAAREVQRVREAVLPTLDDLADEGLVDADDETETEAEEAGDAEEPVPEEDGVLMGGPHLFAPEVPEAEATVSVPEAPASPVAPPQEAVDRAEGESSVRLPFWKRWLGGVSEVPPPAPVPEAPVPEAQRTELERQRQELANARRALEEEQEELEAEQHRLATELHQAGRAALRIRHLLDSVLAGYAMSLQRVERTLPQHGLEPIHTVGQPFDPETMEAVEVVTDSDRPGTEVIEEVRRGYRWRGRVFRYAQVRVARP